MSIMTEETTPTTLTPGQRVRVASQPDDFDGEDFLTDGEGGYASQRWQGREVTVVTVGTATGYGPDTVLVRDESRADTHYLHRRFLTPLQEESPEDRAIRVGDRVRFTERGATGGYRRYLGQVGTVEAIDADDRDRGPEYDLVRVRLDEGGPVSCYRLRLERVASEQPDLRAGVRVRMCSDPGYEAHGRGYVSPAFANAEGVVTYDEAPGATRWRVRRDGTGVEQWVHRDCLTVIDGGQPTETGAPTDNAVRVGDHVRVGGGSGATLGRIARVPVGATYGRESRHTVVPIRRTNGHEVEYYLGDLALVRRDDSPVPQPEPVDPLPLGQRVWSAEHGNGTVIAKAESGLTSSAALLQSVRYAAVRFGGGTVVMVHVGGLTMRSTTDYSRLSEAEQLRVLQRLIHRVASFEAVRRNWCDEVNGALRHLDGLMPEPLQRVDRDLGRRLAANPTEIFQVDLDAPLPEIQPDADDEDDDEPDEVDRTFDVEIRADYRAEGGFRVLGAEVTVTVEGTWPEDHVVDSDDLMELLTERAVVRAIDESSLPDVEGWDLDEWSIYDYTEVDE